MEIRLEHISKTIKKRNGLIDILDDVNLTVHGGDIIGIMGPSGSGKTTLLSIMAGLTPASGGVYLLDSRSLPQKMSGILSFRRDNIAMIPQNFLLAGNLTAYENIVFPQKNGKTDSGELQRVTQRLHIDGILDKRTNTLSAGECQRVCIARAVMMNRKLILADEPTSSVDEENKTVCVHLLSEAAKNGAAVVIVTHDHDVAGMCTSQYMLRDGRLLVKDI